MKKSVIIIVVVAVAVLGPLVWFGQSKPLDKTLEGLKAEKNANIEKMKVPVLNLATLNITMMIDTYYKDSVKGKTSFEKDADSITKVNNYIAGVKNERNIDVEYYINSNRENFVVKTKIKGDNSFNCLDTTSTDSVNPVVVDSIEKFASSTDCKGVVFK